MMRPVMTGAGWTSPARSIVNTPTRSRDAFTPGWCRSLGPRESKRAQGMPGDGLTHGPPATKKAGGSHHRFSQINRHSLRDGFNGFLRALPGDHCLVATVARETRERLHDLSACIGAPGPPDFAVR